MERSGIVAAARLFVHARRSGMRPDSLLEACRPRDAHEANAIVREVTLKVGQIIATGSFSGFSAVTADRPVVASFEGFGSAEATFRSAA